jgi:long-chain acyl-CoA synthetase
MGMRRLVLCKGAWQPWENDVANSGHIWRDNIRDPLADRLIGPGKAFEFETVTVAGVPQQVFKGAPRNLAGLYRMGMAYGERVAVVQDSASLTYAELFARAAALSRALREDYGMQHGTRVALVTSNRIEWVVAVLAITGGGGIVALINSRGVAEEMLRAIALAECDIAILDAERAALIAAAERNPAWAKIIIGEESFEAASAPIPGLNFSPQDMAPGDGAVILFTSGTTGFPKGALLSHGALAHSATLSNVVGTLQDLRYEEETGVALPATRRSMVTPAVILGPMFHLSGMVPVFRAISLGTTIHIMGKWNADIAFDMIEQAGMNRLSFVPAMLWDMLRSPRATPETLSKVAYMINGAAPLNPSLLAEIRERMPHCLLANTYGQTETTAWTCSISGQTYLDNPASCGWAVPTVQVQVRRDDGSEADLGEPGELWVSSAALMNGYYGNAKATAETLQLGWLASGDIAVVDAQGLYTIVDRKKNLVISGGENIYCAEVERVLSDIAGVRECIVYGLPDERLGERLAATLVVESGAALSADGVKAFCRGKLAIYKVPREVALIETPLPRTASGKIDRGTFLASTRDEAGLPTNSRADE